MKQWIRFSSVAALLVLVAVGIAWTEEAEESPCAMCHDDVQVQLSSTIHGLTAARGGPSCQDCHGDGVAHMDAGGDPDLMDLPDETACRACHQRRNQPELIAREVHHNRGVHCADCHAIHDTASDRQPLLTAPAGELCATCHTAEQARFNRPHGHRLDRAGVMQCISCHDPHGERGNGALKIDRSGDGPCVTCHSEKRGPFVFPHVDGIAGDCMSCHEPHGSSNPMALIRSRVDQLCLECHSPISGGTFGSQTPSSHNLRTPQYRQCTVCHVAIHGSNTSPQLLK